MTSKVDPRLPFYVTFEHGDGKAEFEKRLNALSVLARKTGFVGIRVLKHQLRSDGCMEALVRFVKREVRGGSTFAQESAGSDRPGFVRQEYMGGDSRQDAGAD